MRYMMIVLGNDDYQAGKPPSPALMAAINDLAEETKRTGKMIASEGLTPAVTRIRLTRGKRSVVDGPFAETKEMIGGFAIFEVDSKDEALALAQRFVDAHVKAGVENFEMEIRKVFGPEDFGGCGAGTPYPAVAATAA